MAVNCRDDQRRKSEVQMSFNTLWWQKGFEQPQPESFIRVMSCTHLFKENLL